MRISAPAFSAVSSYVFLSRHYEISKDFPCLRVLHESPAGYVDHQVLAVGAKTMRTLAVSCVSSLKASVILEISERNYSADCLENDISALASVSSVGAAFRDELFAPEAQCTVASPPGLNVNFCYVYKFHVPIKKFAPYFRGVMTCSNVNNSYSAGTTETYLRPIFLW